MAFRKTATATVQNPSISLSDWYEKWASRPINCKTDGSHKFCKTASSILVPGETSQYLLSHCTILASVMTEPEPFDYYIKPETAIFVNSNLDAFPSNVVKLAYKTFIGAFNFLEHFQNSKHAKGHVFDAFLRKITIVPDDVWIYYVDILVGTDLRHKELVDDIRSGRKSYLSMGCVTDLVICSYCGKRVVESSDYCSHLLFHKGLFLPDDDGVPRRVAELCGHPSLPGGGVRFIEASWVKTPAAPSAALRSIISDNWVGPRTPYTAPVDPKVVPIGTIQTAGKAFVKSASLNTAEDDLAALENSKFGYKAHSRASFAEATEAARLRRLLRS